MTIKVIPCQADDECEALGSWLADRIYEYNTQATGYFDGQLLGGCIRNDAGDVIAGFHGHTWGGCCELSHVWVDERYRGQGLGAELLRTAEAEAAARGCAQVVLATHSFQAPGFSERIRYERKYTIQGDRRATPTSSTPRPFRLDVVPMSSPAGSGCDPAVTGCLETNCSLIVH